MGRNLRAPAWCAIDVHFHTPGPAVARQMHAEKYARLDVELTERMKALRIGWFVYTWDPRLGSSLLELITFPVPEAQAMAAGLGAARGDPASEAAIAHAQQVIASILQHEPDADVHVSRAELLNAQRMHAASRRDLQMALHHYEDSSKPTGP